MTTILVPTHAMPQATPLELIAAAQKGITEGTAASAHLAALRAAAAIVVARAKPEYARVRVVSVWALLAMCAPELHEWATYWAAKPDGEEAIANAVRFVGVASAALEVEERR